jgi:hypothetical protein
MSCDNLNIELAKLKDSLQEELEKYNNEVQRLSDQHRKELNDQKNQLDRQANQSHSSILEDLKVAHSAAIKELENSHAASLAVIRIELEDVKKISAKHEENRDTETQRSMRFQIEVLELRGKLVHRESQFRQVCEKAQATLAAERIRQDNVVKDFTQKVEDKTQKVKHILTLVQCQGRL